VRHSQCAKYSWHASKYHFASINLFPPTSGFRIKLLLGGPKLCEMLFLAKSILYITHIIDSKWRKILFFRANGYFQWMSSALNNQMYFVDTNNGDRHIPLWRVSWCRIGQRRIRLKSFGSSWQQLICGMFGFAIIVTLINRSLRCPLIIWAIWAIQFSRPTKATIRSLVLFMTALMVLVSQDSFLLSCRTNRI
jgi:hypothetical protein